MAKQTKSWSPSEVEALITAYESHPILWNYKNKNHKDRAKKNVVHNQLSKMFNTTPEEIARKLHNLKGQFSQEVTKTKKKKSGSGANQNYISNWRYFNALSFLLQGEELEKNATDTMVDTSSETEMHETESHSLNESQHAGSSSVTDGQQASSSIQHNANFKLPNRTSKKRKEDSSLIRKCAHIVNQTNDDDQIFADYVASELRKLSKEGNKKLRRIIQRAIINVQDEEDGVVSQFSPLSYTSGEDSST